eukprot:5203444-Pyramimonas_sp.AAC.1
MASSSVQQCSGRRMKRMIYKCVTFIFYHMHACDLLFYAKRRDVERACRNRAELGCLGITTRRKEQLPVQRAMAREAIKHLNNIIVR